MKSFNDILETIFEFYGIVFIIMWIALSNINSGQPHNIAKAAVDALFWPAYIVKEYRHDK